MAAQPQSDVQREVPAAAEPGASARDEWEFLWRFIAVAMLIETGWVTWVAMQINPTPIALPAAYQAAARALATRNVQGDNKGADPVSPREPPVNVEKLKFSESIETPIPERPATSATQREQ